MTLNLLPPFTKEDILAIIKELDQKTHLDGATVPIRISPYMKKTLAYYKYHTNGFTQTSVEFAFSKKLLTCASYEQFRDTVIHEYTHYYQVRMYGKTSHDRLFTEDCQRLGGSGEYKQKEPLAYLPEEEKARYLIECERCKTTYHYHRETKLIKHLKEHTPHTYYCPTCGHMHFTLKES